jgi:hypothetical protein
VPDLPAGAIEVPVAVPARQLSLAMTATAGRRPRADSESPIAAGSLPDAHDCVLLRGPGFHWQPGWEVGMRPGQTVAKYEPTGSAP